MSYIKKDGRREALQKGESALTAGELNYQIFYHVKHNQPINVFKQKVTEELKNLHTLEHDLIGLAQKIIIEDKKIK